MNRIGSSRATLALLAALALALVSCAGGAQAPAASIGGFPGATAEPSAVPTPSPTEPLTEEFPRDSFGDPLTIDNTWLPVIPGTTWRWEGQTVEDGETLPHAVVMTVTDLTKVIDGIPTVVVVDRDYADDELVEAEIVFVAQDDEGNVWHLGQYPEEYEDGAFVDAPAWLAGIDGSLAGYWMTAEPQVGKRSYSQGWGPAVEWTDRGKVILRQRSDCVALGCFDEVLVVEEWALDEPLARQLKFYAPGVGNIRVDWSGSADQEQETLELVEFRQLSDEEMSEIRSTALALEARAYEIHPDLFGPTEPMHAH